MPPIVAPSSAPSGGSSASIWPSAANAACASASRTPASQHRREVADVVLGDLVQRRSSRGRRRRRRRPPQASLVPPPTGRTACARRPVGADPPGQLLEAIRTAPPGRRSRAGAAGRARGPRRTAAASASPCRGWPARRVERAAQALERVEVGLVEHLRHVLLLVDADAVLAGDRAAGVQARVEDLARTAPRPARPRPRCGRRNRPAGAGCRRRRGRRWRRASRTPCPSSSMRSSTSGSLVRGITPSCTK